MKVTVCFGPTRVIVPCPNESMLVRDLIREATLRYRKAAGKGPDSWVIVQKLKSQSDGGILDPDDKLVDVVDDREQIMAIYEEDADGIPSLQHNAGDGTSASSVGTNSPDIFQGNDQHKFQPFSARTDIEITGEELSGTGSGSPNGGGGGLSLQVRRGSEPALNRLSPVHLVSSVTPDPSKRWSAAPVIDDDDIKDSSGVTTSENNNNSSTFSSSVIVTRTESAIAGNETVKSMAAESNSCVQNNMVEGVKNYSTMVTIQKDDDQGGVNQSSGGDVNTRNPNENRSSDGVTLRNNSGSRLKSGPSGTSSASNSHFGGLPSRFSRDSNRLSMQIGADGGRWMEAADRALWLTMRKEPLGANASSPEVSPVSDTDGGTTPSNYLPSPAADSESFPVFHRESNLAQRGIPEENGTEEPSSQEKEINEGEEIELTLLYEPGPLGIHVVPEHRGNIKNQGLIVQSVEPGGRIHRDGRIVAGDKIIEINSESLVGVPFQKAQEHFREGLNKPQLRLRVIKSGRRRNSDRESNNLSEDYKLPSVSVQNLVQKFNGDPGGTAGGGSDQTKTTSEEKENMIQSEEKIVGDAKVATVSPTKKLPLQAVPLLQRPASATAALITSNTRKIGRKYEIDLQKGPQGLGFSITTRDNPAGGNCPIYIKNILPTGAAIDDGRLRPGDRLLEVNGVEMTGKSQGEAVSMLRNVPQGGIVKLVVSRQERVDLSPKLPRQIPPEKVTDDVNPDPWSEREIIALDIPVLDTEKAGLGISVKGKTTASQGGNMIDMGIYIKSVIHGGAASRDGRLRPNDQLLSINGVSLLNRSNTDAMETLRKTMTQDGPKPKPGFITLTIARRVLSSSAPTTDISGGGSSASGDEMDSWGSRNNSISVDGNRSVDKSYEKNSRGENTAIFLPAYEMKSPGSHQPDMYQSRSQEASHYTPQQQHQSTPISQRNDPQVQLYSQQHQQQQQHQREYSLSPPQAVDRILVDLPRNPVLDRLTGKVSNPAQRSESYYRATNETWNATLMQSVMNGSEVGHNSQQWRQTGTVVHNLNGEAVLIEDDYSAPQKPPRRSRSSTPDDALNASNGVTSPAVISNPVSSPGDPPQPPLSDVTYASQTSLEDAGGFSRDAFGRQSMSEKRHATLDAKNTDTYQRNKKLREERERQRQLQAQQEALNEKKLLGEALARERNLQDELARRGVKRPFSSSTEDDLGHRCSQTSPPLSSQNSNQGGGGVGGGGSKGRWWESDKENRRRIMDESFESEPPHMQQHREQRASGTRSKKGLGDQLIELFHQWGHKQQQTHRLEGGASLARVNSADSLVDATKHHHPGNQQHSLRPGGPNQTLETGGFKGSKRDIGPSLGMKKSSSLESLQTMVQEIQIQEDLKAGYAPARAGPASVRVVRGRGCNESFRQAVDRSYEAPLGELGVQMEPLAEEETESCISGPYGQLQRIPMSEASVSDVDDIYGKTKGLKKKPGLLRGLGSMFRFGRHRKSTSGGSGLSASAVRKQQAALEKQEREEYEEAEKEKARQAAQAEQNRIQEQYRRLVERQKNESSQQQQQQQHSGNYGMTVSIGSRNTDGSRSIERKLGPSQTQFRKSMENQAIREREREREQQRQQEQHQRDVNGNHFQNPPNHPRSASYDVYNEMTRPGSRVGFVDPKKYSHYINYDEIRHHLNDGDEDGGVEKQNGGKLSEEQLRQMRFTVIEQRKKAILESRRHQQHYHSQRRENPKSRQDRPVSNFYEYESVQAAMHAQHSSPHHRHHHQDPHNHHQQQQQQQHRGQIAPPPFQSTPEQQQQQQHQHRGQVQMPSYGTVGHGNNGITLPSPSSALPFSVLMERNLNPSHTVQSQSSSSRQYGGPSTASFGNAATLQHQHSQQKLSVRQPNSLPRRSQRDFVMPTTQQVMLNPTSHRHHQQQQHQHQPQQFQQPSPSQFLAVGSGGSRYNQQAHPHQSDYMTNQQHNQDPRSLYNSQIPPGNRPSASHSGVRGHTTIVPLGSKV